MSNEIGNLLRNRSAQLLTVALLANVLVFYGLAAHGEQTLLLKPLNSLPHTVNDWRMVQETAIEKEVQDVLKADDTLNRVYAKDNNTRAYLFMAFFKSQRTGAAPHSPKNCLPGAGWTPTRSDMLDINIPGRAEPITVNRYIVSKGDSKSLVMYWYQSHNRVIASEYSAKVYLVLDSIRYRRSDTSLIRVTVPFSEYSAEAWAEQTAIEFVQTIFQSISQSLPGKAV